MIAIRVPPNKRWKCSADKTIIVDGIRYCLECGRHVGDIIKYQPRRRIHIHGWSSYGGCS